MTYAKLFQNGRSQAVRLPKEFRFDTPGNEVIIKKIGKAVVLMPKSALKDILLDAIARFPDDFDVERDKAPPKRDIEL